MNNSNSPYFNFLHAENENTTASETFIDTTNLAWVKNIEDHFEIIREEMNHFLASNEKSFKPYFATQMMDRPGSWKILGFVFWGLKFSSNYKKCRQSLKIFEKVPGFVSLSLSKMEPHSEIKAHYGDTDAIYRCHLPLKVAGKIPEIGFQVGYEPRSWEIGKLMVFNDVAYHKGWNKTDEERIILMIDVIRPEYLHQKNKICAMVLASLAMMYFFKHPFTRKNDPLTRFYIHLISYFFRVWFFITGFK